MKLQLPVFSRLLLTLVIFTLPAVVLGQEATEINFEKDNVISAGFPANALVLLANGNEKYISDIKEGDTVVSYDPVADGYTTSLIKKVHTIEKALLPVVSVMLVLEDLSVSLQVNGGLAGVSLQATSDQAVLTADGQRTLRQLQEKDKLYCFDEASGKFQLFTVYAIQIHTPVVEKIYALQTDTNIYLINNTVVFSLQ